MLLFHTSPYATELLWEGPKGLRGTMRHGAKSSADAIAAGSAKCTQGATLEDKISLAYFEYVAVLDFVLHRVIICHDSAHDGIPAKIQKHIYSNDLFFFFFNFYFQHIFCIRSSFKPE